MSGEATERASSQEPEWTRWLPALLVPAALLSDLAAALPVRSYFFRDFTVTFLPLRLFAARELREGRLPFWNPYVFEGTFQLPAIYPLDLLHVLWPGPVFVAWLLTLHLPLAALAAFWLARELGASRCGAFVSGTVFALGGFALSCLNLYVFLQALALAPLVVGSLRRAAVRGGRWPILAALAAALALSTLALEFVAQALLLGLALGLAASGRRGLPRLAVALGLGIGAAGLPVAVVCRLLPETARGAGFAPAVALANSVHPAVLLQSLLPHLFGVPGAAAWWGGRFFSKGMPYFLSLYLGPLALAFAMLGIGALERRVRMTLLGGAGLGLWYALGASGGLAPALLHLPFATLFRFPSKGLLLPYLAVAVAAGFGTDRLLRDARAFGRLAAISCGIAATGVVVALLMYAAPAPLVAWSGVIASYWPAIARLVAGDAAASALLACGSVAVALLVRRGLVRPGPAAALLIGLLAADLARAGSGINRQVPRSFFEPLPEMTRLPLRDPAGGRVFSYGLEQSPVFQSFLSASGPERALAGFFIDRQLLGPYTNMLDGLESPEATDLTSFTPRPPELTHALYDPTRVDQLSPWLRNAAVSRVLSLDPLRSPDLTLLGIVPVGPAGLAVHAYALRAPWPRAYLACNIVQEPDLERALLRPYAPGFDPRRDAVLKQGAASCREGGARPLGSVSGEERFEVDSDGDGYLVVRASFARGWRATVDGGAAPVLRANGKHRAVPVSSGRHQVVLRYEAPGRRAGTAASALSLLACVALLLRPTGRSRGRRP